MAYVGVQDPAERRDVIAYLATLVAGAAPVVAAADPFGPDWPAGSGREQTGAACNACHSLAIVKQQRLPRARMSRRRWLHGQRRHGGYVAMAYRGRS